VDAETTRAAERRHSYHHGALRRALLDAALQAIAESGPTGWSLRELARRVGVSNAASTRHFARKRDLFTAIASDGFAQLARDVEAAWARRRQFVDVGAAYVAFASANPQHFAIMCRPDLYDSDEIHDQRSKAFSLLSEAVSSTGAADPTGASLAAWALVHGIATLSAQGLLPGALSAPAAFHLAGKYLFQAEPTWGAG
jgi:AcrR family transcriptional regulator